MQFSKLQRRCGHQAAASGVRSQVASLLQLSSERKSFLIVFHDIADSWPVQFAIAAAITNLFIILAPRPNSIGLAASGCGRSSNHKFRAGSFEK